MKLNKVIEDLLQIQKNIKDNSSIKDKDPEVMLDGEDSLDKLVCFEQYEDESKGYVATIHLQSKAPEPDRCDECGAIITWSTLHKSGCSIIPF